MGCGQSRGNAENELKSREVLNSSSSHAARKCVPDIVITKCDTMGSASQPNVLTIIHFNDVYNIEPQDQEPVGGAARFQTAIKNRQHLNPLVLFSGDVFNPSVMSAVTKGRQMVPILNAFGVNCAVYGNHDFDFGIDKLVQLKEETNFPWLMSNVIDNLTNQPLAFGLTSKMIDWHGKKVGVVGLVEEEWIATLSTIEPEDITFLDYVKEGQKLACKLKQDGADIVIALTHMRWPNDERLAELVPEIDLILGGHDHDYNLKRVHGKFVLKSGTDFRQMSQLTITFSENNKMITDIEIQEIDITSKLEEDPEVKQIVKQFAEVMGERMNKVIGCIEVDLDGRFASIRTKETNLGNFITDIMLTATDADVALLNSGTLRSDRVHAKGDFRLRDLMSILPLCDPVVVLSLTGAQVLAALENGVSQYPKLEGRFPQVSGVIFAFDPEKPAGQRVNEKFVKIQGDFLDKSKVYKLATKQYLSEGRDGYDVLKECPIVVNDEEGPRLSTIVQNHFTSLRLLKREGPGEAHHRQSILTLQRRRSLLRQMTFSPTNSGPSSRDSSSRDSSHERDAYNASVHLSPASILSPSRTRARSPKTATEKRAVFKARRESVISIEKEVAPGCLAPQVEGRIMILTPERRRQLEDERMIQEMRKEAIREESIETTDIGSSTAEQ